MSFFFIYCFIGWCFESTYVSIKKKHFVNRGFLPLPMLPIYGFGAIILLLVSIPVENNYLLMFVLGMAAATLLEYVTGAVMEALFKVKYWDYSSQKYNYKGYICLSSSITWGAFSIVLTKVIHRSIENVVLTMDQNINIIITIVVLIIFASNVVVAVRAAWDIRVVIEKMTLLKKELVEIEEYLRQVGQDGKQKIEEFKDNIKEQGFIKRIGELKEEYIRISDRIDFRKSSLIKGNPSASSRHFREAFEDLKKKFRR